MKARRILITQATLVLLGLLLLKFVFRNSDSFLGRVSSYIFSNNNVELVCSGVDPKSVDVIWNTEEGQSKIIESGNKIASVGYEYGPNRFLISLSDSITFKVGNWKTNRWNSHDYRIEIIKDDNGYKVNFLANGVNFDRTELHYNSSGEYDGAYRSYFENGNLSVQATYADGRPNGTKTFYSENGKIRATNEYLNGEANGVFINYGPDGKLNSKRNIGMEKKSTIHSDQRHLAAHWHHALFTYIYLKEKRAAPVRKTLGASNQWHTK